MTAPAPSRSGSPGPVWTAAAVARRLGVAPGTLRSWGRRYGIGPAAHVAGRHRRYTSADVAELDTMHELVTQGMVHSAAAAIARSQHRSVDEQCRSVPSQAMGDGAVDELVTSAARLDLDTTTEILAAGLDAHGVVETWEGLCRPALLSLDAAAADERDCTDGQLLLSWAISTCLRRLPPTWSGPDVRPVLLACAARDQHTLPMEALFAALVEHRIPARMLGAAVPASALRHAARQLRPSAVVLWAQRPLTARPGTLRQLAAHTDAVVAAGPGWRHSSLPAGAERVDDFPAALALITAQTSAAGPDRARVALRVRGTHPA